MSTYKDSTGVEWLVEQLPYDTRKMIEFTDQLKEEYEELQYEVNKIIAAMTATENEINQQLTQLRRQAETEEAAVDGFEDDIGPNLGATE